MGPRRLYDRLSISQQMDGLEPQSVQSYSPKEIAVVTTADAARKA